MEELRIYFSDSSELAEYESSSKGYRTDVYVKIHNNVFNVKVYNMIRLRQDFESELESYGYYASEPNLILVKDVNKKEIITTIKELYKQKYFDKIKPANDIEVKQFMKVQ